MLLSLSIGSFCKLLFFDKFSLLLVVLVLVAFKSACGAVIDDKALLPDCNNIVNGPTESLPLLLLLLPLLFSAYPFVKHSSAIIAVQVKNDGNPN
jgi:hypothetical protein